MLFFISLSSVLVVKAADKTSIANVTVTSEGPTQVEHWTEISFRVNFKVNESGRTVDPGDTIYVAWNSTQGTAIFDPYEDEFDLEKDGEVYAHVHITHDGVLITFTDVVEHKYDIEGNVYIHGRVRKQDAPSETTEKFVITINGEAVLEYDVTPSGDVISGTSDVKKYGERASGYDYVLSWNVRINEDAEDTFNGDVTFTDTLNAGHKLIEGECFLLVYTKVGEHIMTIEHYHDTLSPAKQLELKETISHIKKSENPLEYYSYDDIKHRPIALRYTEDGNIDYWYNDAANYLVYPAMDDSDNPLTINDYLGNNSFETTHDTISMVFPEDKIDNRFMQLVYYTNIINQSMSTFENTAEVEFVKTGTDEHHSSETLPVEYKTSSGDITGNAYQIITVTKVDSEGNTLEGIYFRVTSKNDPHFNEIIITDTNGIARLSHLTADEYYVKELTEEEAKQIDPNASYPDDLVIDTTTYTVTIGTSESTTFNNDLEVENTYESNTSLKIEKLLAGDAASADDEFTFEIILSDTSINGTYSDVTFTNGKANITLKGNQSKTITNLPADITYTVNELENTLGYIPTCDSNTGTLEEGKTSTVTYTNTKDSEKEYGSFRLRKTVSGSASKDTQYHVNVRFILDGEETDNQNVTLTVNRPVTFNEIPIGTTIIVKELDTGYTVTYTVNNRQTNQFVLEDVGVVEMVINNHKEPPKETPPPSTPPVPVPNTKVR